MPGFSTFRAPSRAAAKLNDAPAVALGGAALGQPHVLLHRLAIRREMQTRFAACVGFAVKGLRHGGGTAHSADQQNLNLKNPALVFNSELVAGANFAGGFGPLSVRLNAANVAGARGHGARFEEARGPKPLIETQLHHSKTWAAVAVRSEWSCQPSGGLLDLPYVQELCIARCRHLDAFLMRGAVQRGADVFLRIGQRGQGNFQGSSRLQAIDVRQQARDDAFMLAITAFWDIVLKDRLEALVVGFRLLSVRMLKFGRYFADSKRLKVALNVLLN